MSDDDNNKQTPVKEDKEAINEDKNKTVSNCKNNEQL